VSPAAEREGPIVEWPDTEPGFRELVDELARLFRRARRRPVLVILLTLALTGLMVLRSAGKQISYGAKVKLLVTESEVEANSRETRSGSRIYTSDKLRDFVANAAFTDGKVLETFKKLGYRTRDIENNPRLVLQSFREDVEIDINRNHFLEEPMGSPRTANISIGYRLPDPEMALRLVRALGDLVVERDAEYRKDAYEAARTIAGHELKIVRERIDKADAQRAEAKAKMDMARLRVQKSEHRYRVKQMEDQLLALNYELVAARDRYNELRMMDNAGAMGLRFERIDWGAAEAVVNKKIALVRFGIMILLMSFPFVAMAVGGFDRRVYDPGDVRRLGLTPLGTVRAPRAQPSRD
jgi:hypothetical protein